MQYPCDSQHFIKTRTNRDSNKLVTSQFVIDEASLGDADAAARRLAVLTGVAVLIPDV